MDYKAFFENLSEIVYMTDIETNEIVFMNKFARSILNNIGESEYIGRKCYELIHNKTEVCEFCTNPRLKENEFYEWIFYNQHVNRYLSLKDTLIEENGRKLRLEIAMDMNAEYALKDALKEISNKEKMINDALAAAMEESDPDRSINIMLSTIGNRMESDRIYIFEDNNDGTFDNTYEWCKKGVTPQIKNLKRLPYVNGIELWYNEFDKDSNIVIYDLEEYKEVSPSVYKILKPQNINSLVAAPIYVKGKRIGFYGVDNPPLHEVENISTIFDVLGKFIASLLRNRDNVRRAIDSGYTDYLTGLKNRSAMQVYLENADPTKSQGYIFCDINGLKKTNDEQGHAAGDELIEGTAGTLTNRFSHKQVFRLGGDEFLVIRIGQSKEELAADEQALRDDFKKANISVAIGSSWRPIAGAGFDTLFKEADERMYNDKRLHYGERRKG